MFSERTDSGGGVSWGRFCFDNRSTSRRGARHCGSVPWEFTDDVEVYAERAWDLLAVAPAENTLALTVIQSVRAGRRWSEDPMLFGWYEAGRTAGAVSMTPPYELLLAAVPDHALGELVSGLRARAVRIPGVNGDIATADRFAAAWTAGSPLRASAAMRLRLYVLGTLRPPDTAATGPATAGRSGRLRRRGGLVHRVPNRGRRPRRRRRPGSTRPNRGRAGVAMGRHRRHRCVYRSPQPDRGWRRARCSGVHATGAAAIYQQIGYRPVRDQQVIHFVA